MEGMLPSRPYGAVSLLSCPAPCAAPLWEAGNEDEAPSAGTLRPPCSARPVTAIRNYGPANALQTTTSYEQAFAVRATLVIDLGMGSFRTHNCWRACSPARRRDLRSWQPATPHLSCPCRSAAQLWLEDIQGEALSAGNTAAPLLVSACHSDPQVQARKCDPDNNFIRTGVCRPCQTRRRCRYGLLSNTRLPEGMLSWPGKGFASVRRHASPLLSSSVCCPALARRYPS